MSWRQVLSLSWFLTALLLTTVFTGGDRTAVGSKKSTAGESSKENPNMRVFVRESDASNFLEKPRKRGTEFRSELRAKTMPAVDERGESYEEQRNESEILVVEELDERDEINGEQMDQWSEHPFDGPLYEA